MDFLTLAQRLHQEAGLQGTPPAAVTSQTGINAKVVDWIKAADNDIQSLHKSWRFRQGEFSFSTIAATRNYTPAAAGITDLSAWRFNPDPTRLSGVRVYSSSADETDLVYLPWDEFRATYGFGAHRSTSGRPIAFSIKWDDSLETYPTPDAVYTMNGEYVKTVDEMSATTDEPPYPSDFHMIVVWRALMLYGAFEGASDAYTHGQNEYDDLLYKLREDQLPKIKWGPSLA